MSLKTHENNAAAKLITFDKQIIFLTMDEYQVYRTLSMNPNVKTMVFDDGEVAISDIRRVEVLSQPIKDSERLLESNAADLDEDDWLSMVGDKYGIR